MQARLAREGMQDDGASMMSDGHDLGDTGILRKNLFNQNLSDWAARYRKNKQHLEVTARDCEMLRAEVAKNQQLVDEAADAYEALEYKFDTQILAKFNETKATFDNATQQKCVLSIQLKENRNHKASMQREKKGLTADYERKHAELMRMAEVHDKLDHQLHMLTQQLGQLAHDRRRMERDLGDVHNNLKANTDLADEVSNEINHVHHGIRDSMDLHMLPGTRLEQSFNLSTSRGVLDVLSDDDDNQGVTAVGREMAAQSGRGTSNGKEMGAHNR